MKKLLDKIEYSSEFELDVASFKKQNSDWYYQNLF